MANDEVVIRFKADGGNLDQILKQLQTELGKIGGSNAPQGLKNTSDALAKLSSTLGTSYKSALEFSTQIGLTAEKSAQAAIKIKELDAVGASSAQKFAVLAKELGVTRQQFDALNRAASGQNTSLRQSSESVARLAQTLGTSTGNARAFAQQIGLTAAKSSEAVSKLRALDAVGATNAEKFRALSRELGVTRQQFDALNGAASKSKEGLQALGIGTGAIAAGLGAVGLKGLKTFADFDAAIRTFGVVTQSSGTAALGELRAEVERLSKATTKTPQEIAALAVELGKAGFSAEDTKKALAGVVQSSEATGEGLARTGEVVGSTLTQFGLAADQSQKIADLLTTASNVSASGTNDLGEALSYVGAQAKDSNQSVNDTITTLAQLANAGIKGSSAGTGLAEALRRIKIASAGASTELDDLRSRGSKNAVAAFDRLNVAVRDSEGNLKPFPEILGIIKQNLGSLGQGDQDLLNNALFGVQGGRVITSLLGQTDEKLNGVTTAMGNYKGAAAAASAELTQGLGPSLTLFASSLQLGIQKVGEFLAVGVEPLVRGATNLINGFIGLPPAFQLPIIAIGALAGALTAATAVITAFQVLNIATTAALALKTAATLASSVATGAATAAQFLFNAQLTVSGAQALLAAAGAGALAIAQGVISGSAALAAGAMSAFSASLATVAAPLAALAAGLAVLELVRFTGQLEEQNKVIDNLTQSTDTALQAGLSAQTGLKNATDAHNEAKKAGLALTDAQIAKEKAVQAEADKSLASLKKSLDAAKSTPEAKSGFGGFGQEEADAQNNARKANIAAIENQIKAIERQKKALEDTNKVAAPTGAKTEKIASDSDKKAEIKNARDEQKRAKDQAFDDAKQRKDQAFQDAKQQREQAFQDAKQQREQAQQDAKAARDEQRADAKAARDEQRQLAAQGRQEAFDLKRQASEDAFRQSQEAKSEAFNKRQQADQEAFAAKQTADKKKFDEGISAEQKAIERRQQLRDADPKERANLQKQFKTADRNAAELEPLDKKRQEFDKKQKEEAKAQAEKQKAEQKAEEDRKKAEDKAFKEQQKAEDKAFKEEERAIAKAQQAEDRAIAKAEKEEDRQIDRAFKESEKAAERAFKESEQAAERAFKAEQQSAERAFKEAQRQFDLETARQTKAVLETTKIPVPELPAPTPGTPAPTSGQRPTPRFAGGDAIAGSPYAVGERGHEIFVPATDGYFLNHRDSMRLAQEAMSSRVPLTQGLDSRQAIAPAMVAAMASPSAGQDPLLAELKSLRKIVESREQKIAVPVKFDGPVTEQNMDRYLRLQRSIMRANL
jgi:TP901 family phage tail tape measure protein